MTDEFLKSFYPEAKSFIVYPFILEGRYERLISIPLKRRFDHNILFIGNGPDWYYKGLDLLVESFKEIKNYYDDAHLYILGNWSNEVVSKYSTEGISFVGYASPEDYVEKCSLYIHLGRGDTFPVSSLEAMLGGLPTIVSEFTGTKEVVSEVNKDFVLPLDKDKIVKRVIEYFELSDEDKYALSLKFRESAKRFRKDIVLEDFEKKWKENVL
ncbi:MAG TPA: glycosyltransferase [Caldisericia bacterium]|nr:glycosyltransferase [Caldisericia bacterium]